MSRMTWGFTGLTVLGMAWAGVVLMAPTPAGACSIAFEDSCQALQAIDAGSPTFESPDGVPVELPATITVMFDGYGQPATIELGEHVLVVGEAQ